MDKVRGFLTGIVFAAIAVGFAWAVPGAMTVSDVAPETTTTRIEKIKEPKPEKTKEPDSEETEAPEQEQAEGEDNHGDAVSTAAHCKLKSRAQGELVSAIAQDKDATVADAEAACAAAQAAQAAEGSERGHGKNGNKGKSEDHKPDDAGSEGSDGGPPADPGSQGNGKGGKP